MGIVKGFRMNMRVGEFKALKDELVIIIEDNVGDLEIIENAIRESHPQLQCISFVHADEAVRVITHELCRKPSYILLDLDLTRIPGTQCLQQLRNSLTLTDCKIFVFSLIMPVAVSDSLVSMGATQALQKPKSKHEYKDMLDEILS